MRSIFTVIAVASGTLLEWYDFTLFAYLAPLLALLFFPQHDPIAALLAIFSVYAAGNFVRVLGALWFGYVGDTYGRQHALLYSIFLMAVPTVLISVTPGYALLGVSASILLVIYRLVQGFALGGEYQGNAIYLVEKMQYSPGLAGSWIVTMVGLGMLLASGVTLLITAPNIASYAWRIAFFCGGLVGLLALYVRYQFKETARFQAALKNKKLVKVPVKTIFKHYPGRFLLAIMLAIGAASYNYSLVFLPTYFTLIHHASLHEATKLLTISLLIGQFITPLVGWLSDKNYFSRSINNKLAFMLAGSIGTLLLAYPIYYFYIGGNTVAIILANLLMGTLCSLYLAPKNAVLTQLFPAEVCYTGFGLAHNIGLAIAGIIPLTLIKLVTTYHMIYAPAYYFMLSSAVVTIALLVLWFVFLKKTPNQSFQIVAG